MGWSVEPASRTPRTTPPAQPRTRSQGRFWQAKIAVQTDQPVTVNDDGLKLFPCGSALTLLTSPDRSAIMTPSRPKLARASGLDLTPANSTIAPSL